MLMYVACVDTGLPMDEPSFALDTKLHLVTSKEEGHSGVFSEDKEGKSAVYTPGSASQLSESMADESGSNLGEITMADTSSMMIDSEGDDT